MAQPKSHLPNGAPAEHDNWGDVGKWRQIEAKIVGGFNNVKAVQASQYFN